MRKTKKQRRVEILKDALLQITKNKYTAVNGRYVVLPKDLRSLEDRVLIGCEEDRSGKECLLQTPNACKVCAKGAIFLSIVRKENKVQLTELANSEVRDEKSQKLFGKRNLDRIEAAFEKWRYFNKKDKEYYRSRKLYLNAAYYSGLQKDEQVTNFIKKYPKSKDRLIAILKNCIKNDGVFKP